MRTLSIIGLLLVFSASGFAQATVPATPVTSAGGGNSAPAVTTGPNLGTLRAILQNARTLARAGNVTQVEAALTALNESKPGTADWFMETARRLLEVAEQLARSGTPDPVASVANRALVNLTLAGTNATDDDTRAAAKSLSGFIQERYLADDDAALASYQAAAQLAPATAKAAKAAADRLQEAKANRDRKPGG